MTFVGNDIMYFANNVQTFERKKSIDKVLSKNELNLFPINNIQNNILIAWTIKESVYKIMCKKGHALAFSPRLINIVEFNKETFSGKVLFQNTGYYFKTDMNNEFIYSFSSDKPEILPEVRHYFFNNKNNNNSSIFNPDFLIFLNKKNWQLKYNEKNIPLISNNNFNIDISITHDLNLMVLCEYNNQ